MLTIFDKVPQIGWKKTGLSAKKQTNLNLIRQGCVKAAKTKKTMHEKKTMLWLCHGAAPCATLLCVRGMSEEFHIVTRRVLHLKWLSDFFFAAGPRVVLCFLWKRKLRTRGVE